MWVKSDFSRFVDCSFKAGSGAVWLIESCLRGKGCTGHGSPEMKFTEEEGGGRNRRRKRRKGKEEEGKEVEKNGREKRW